MNSYRQAVGVLPEPLRSHALEVDRSDMVRTEEIRLRVGRRPSLVLSEGELTIPGARRVEPEDLKHLMEIASRWSFHTVLEQMRRGYLTVEGGHRLGVCGTVVMEGEQIHTLRDITAVNLRVARQITGVAREITGQLVQAGQLRNTLILGPPGAGKTTFLRDLVRCISVGEGISPLRVAVADERGELAAIWAGRPQMDLGERTDVLDGCPKALAIAMLLRGMGPQVIAVDEITAPEDVLAMEQAVGCGVALLATAHGICADDLQHRPLYRLMLEKRIFQKLIIIRVEGGCRNIRVIEMEDILC